MPVETTRLFQRGPEYEPSWQQSLYW